jgi:hypothetical protein
MSGQLHAPAALPRGRAPGIDWIGGCVGPRASVDDVEMKRLNIRNIQKFISYLRGNTLHLRYKNQPVNVI